MPIYAQVVCIGGNALFAALFAMAGFMGLSQGDTGLAVFLLLLAAAAGYSVWVLLKFRRYLGAEQALEREAHIAELRSQLDAIRGQQAPESPAAPGSTGDADKS